MLCTFTVGFQKIYKSCILLFVALPGLIDTLFHSCQLEGPCSDCLRCGDKGSQYKTISSACHCCLTLELHLLFFSLRRSLYNERKHTQTHTHTYTHTHEIIKSCCSRKIFVIDNLQIRNIKVGSMFSENNNFNTS